VKTARRAYVSDLKQSMKAIEHLEEIRAAEQES
jgi:hypothetical protein